MSRKNQLKALKAYRENLLAELTYFYKTAFDNICDLDITEGDIAKLSQILLQSKEAALMPLQKEIESQLIIKAN